MKYATVIGGNSGIGAGVVEVLLSKGWRVTATGISATEIELFSNENNSPNLSTAVLDVTDQEAVYQFFEKINALDGLVNCAGILSRGEEFKVDVFQRVIDVNLTGTMRTCVAAHEALKKNGGAIVNTASMLSYFGGALVPAYAASKGGVAQLTKSLAAAWAQDGIRVNAIAPGWIETPMTDALRADSARNDPILARTPQKRWGHPEEVGNLVAWLLSDEASFINGSLYNVDGGYAAT